MGQGGAAVNATVAKFPTSVGWLCHALFTDFLVRGRFSAHLMPIIHFPTSFIHLVFEDAPRLQGRI